MTTEDHAPRDPAYTRGILMVMAAGCFWSFGGMLVRLIEAAGPWQILLVRSLTLSITLFVVLMVRHRSALTDELRGIGAGALFGNLAALAAIMGFAGFSVTLRRKRRTDTLSLVCLAGIFTALIAALLADGFAISLYDFGLCAVMGRNAACRNGEAITSAPIIQPPKRPKARKWCCGRIPSIPISNRKTPAPR